MPRQTTAPKTSAVKRQPLLTEETARSAKQRRAPMSGLSAVSPNLRRVDDIESAAAATGTAVTGTVGTGTVGTGTVGTGTVGTGTAPPGDLGPDGPAVPDSTAAPGRMAGAGT